MREVAKKLSQKQIVELGIGGNYPWPKLKFDLSTESLTHNTELLIFFGTVFGPSVTVRTARKNLWQASKDPEGKPKEIIQYKTFKFFEATSNQLFSVFRRSLANEEVDKLIESNSDHGYSHQRRLEKLLKEFFKNEPSHRRNSHLLFFLLSQLISIRFHDLLELFPDGKKFHTEGGALLTLGFLNQNREYFNEIVESMGVDRPDDQSWSKIMVSTFITCLYHSKPKLLETIEEKIKNKNKINIETLLTDQTNFDNVLNYFRNKYANKQNLIGLMMSGLGYYRKNKDHPIFTFQEASDLIKSAKIFGAIDKLDSVLPAGLSTARTFVTMKDNPRPFFAVIEDIIFDDNHSIKPEIIDSPLCQTAVNKIRSNQPLEHQDEYYLRLALAEGHFSPDDFSRLLFETQRVDFHDLPEWLMAAFKFALEEKGNFLLAMIPELLTSGSFQRFELIYHQAEVGLLTEFLSKYGATESNLREIVIYFLRLQSHADRDDYINNEIVRVLDERGIDSSGIKPSIITLRSELLQLEKILKIKIDQLKEAGLTGLSTAQRAKSLLNLAIVNRHLPNIDTMLFTESYRSYFPITASI